MSEPDRQPVSQAPPPNENLGLAQMGLEIEDDGRARELARERSVARQRLLWENRSFILRIAAAAAFLSVIVAFLIPKRYQSTARLMPPDQPSPALGMLSAATSISAQVGSDLGSMAGDLLGLRSSSDLFIGILQSRSVQDQLIGRFELRKVYSAERMEDARRELNRHTELSSDRKSGIITISVEDHSPERAAAMAGEYIGELNRVVTDLNTSSAHRERAFLEERLVQVKQDLQSSEKNFSDFASKNTALDIPDQGKAMIEGLASLEGESIATETELQGLKQIYADGSVQVRATQAKADRLQGELKKYLGEKGGDGPADDKRDAQPLYPSLRELPVLGVSYADLFRNTKIEEAVFQALTQEYELAKVQEAKETPSVKVLDPPDVPDKETYPPKLAIIAVGTILAIVASMLWILGKNSWDRADGTDPQKVFAREVIGTLQGQIQRAMAMGAARNRTDSKFLGRFRREDASGKC